MIHGFHGFKGNRFWLGSRFGLYEEVVREFYDVQFLARIAVDVALVNFFGNLYDFFREKFVALIESADGDARLTQFSGQ